jgi:hypothetical protein
MAAEMGPDGCSWCGAVVEPFEHFTYCPLWGPYCDECEDLDEAGECRLCGRYFGR